MEFISGAKARQSEQDSDRGFIERLVSCLQRKRLDIKHVHRGGNASVRCKETKIQTKETHFRSHRWQTKLNPLLISGGTRYVYLALKAKSRASGFPLLAHFLGGVFPSHARGCHQPLGALVHADCV